jgi:hypothetical protein
MNLFASQQAGVAKRRRQNIQKPPVGLVDLKKTAYFFKVRQSGPSVNPVCIVSLPKYDCPFGQGRASSRAFFRGNASCYAPADSLLG